MTVPTREQVIETLKEHMSQFPDHLWAWGEIVAVVRKKYNSTTPAIESRMNPMVDNGDIVSVRISKDGLIFWGNAKAETTYFKPSNATHRGVVAHGSITLKRPQDMLHRSIWLSSVHYYMLAEDHDRVIDHLVAARQEGLRKYDEDKKNEDKAFQAAIREIASDGPDLLKAFSELTRGRVFSNMTTYMSSIKNMDDKSYPVVHLHLQDDDIKILLDILRDGMKKDDKPSE